MPPSQPTSRPPQYRWPFFLVVAVVLGLVLAFLWMRREVERTRFRIQPMPETPVQQTNPRPP